MECVVIIVNGVKRLTIITKHSILDVVAALDSPLVMGNALLSLLVKIDAATFEINTSPSQDMQKQFQ